MSIQNRIASDVYKLAASATTPQQMQALQQHLSQSIQSGALPGYIGIPVVQDLTQRMHHAQTAQAGQQPQQPPIAQQVMQQAQAEAPGVDQLQSNLPTHMAAGGIIAFEDGGEVPRYANRGLVKLSREQYDSLTPDMQQVYVNQYGAPPPSTAPAGNQLNPIGLNTAPPSPAVLAAMQGTPLQPQAQQAPNVTALPAVNVATRAPAATPPAATPPPAPAGDKYTNPMAGADKLFTKPKKIEAQQLSDLGGDYQALLDANPGMTAEEAMARRQAMLGADTGRDEIRQKLKDMEAKTSKDDERSPWMALMKAGLATMAGTSPYALSNIGKGGMEGMSDYAAAQERVDKAREKQLDINQRIAQADRAEKVAAVDYGLNSEERDKARAEKIRLDKLATKAHVQGTNAQNDLAAQEHNVTNQMNYGKNVADARYQQGMLDVHHETNQIQKETKALTKEQSAATNMLKISMQPIMAKLKASGMADEDAYDAALYQALSQMPEDKVALLGYNPASVKNLATPRAKGSAVLKDGVYYYQPAK